MDLFAQPQASDDLIVKFLIPLNSLSFSLSSHDPWIHSVYFYLRQLYAYDPLDLNVSYSPSTQSELIRVFVAFNDLQKVAVYFPECLYTTHSLSTAHNRSPVHSNPYTTTHLLARVHSIYYHTTIILLWLTDCGVECWPAGSTIPNKTPQEADRAITCRK